MDDLHGRLRGLGLKTPRLQKNPVTYDWILVTDFLREHATAMGAGLVGLPHLWMKQLKGTTNRDSATRPQGES